MLSGDSGQGESICTPRSVSKRLFGASGSSSKRNLFGQSENRTTSKETELSGEESDLGPMSPLALTDMSESSPQSSPGRSFVSPLVTPEKSPRSLKAWDRLRPNSARDKSDNRVVTFDALKSLTRAARSSPKRKIVLDSSKSVPVTPTRGHPTESRDWMIGTPERQIALLFEEIVPETPRKETTNDNYEDDEDRVEETPEKCNARPAEQRLVTPLSSVLNEIAVPRLNRRKSLCLLGDEETRSPERMENVSKRRATDYLQSAGAKVQKIDENHYPSVPKARASLFPDTSKMEVSPIVTDDFKMSTKQFYNGTTEKRVRSIGNVDRSIIEKTQKRHSLPSYTSNHNCHKRATRRTAIRNGEINAGVRHGIKRPKPRRHVSRVEAFKKEKRQKSVGTPVNGVAERNAEDKTIENTLRVSSGGFVDSPSLPPSPPSPSPPPPSSPTVDPSKRFFKTNRTIKSHNSATVTVNDKIKLKVSGGKIALNGKTSRVSRNPRKRARLEEISFDATDLTVDEPSFDVSVEKRNVFDGILRVLEDDWADDEYDTMETLTVVSPTRANPVRVSSNDYPSVTMSPASVLSNMTLSMNIKDSAKAPETTDNVETRLYPVFEKGYSSGITDENITASKKKSERGLKRSWQTSAKGGGAENQYQIDAGQKRFGATTCGECGIVYQLGDPEDENAHLNYHNNVKILKFNGWKQERVIVTDPFTNSRVIGIEPGDPKQCWKKVEQVLTVVDKDLGLAEMEVSSYLDKKIYFYVRDKTILGVMVAESIKVAHRMIPEFAELNCCSAEDTPAKCGVNVIWTAMSHRRKHIATKLLDALRTNFYFGYIMSLDDIAFSMPTPSGKIFAEKYTKTRNFKVYS